MTRRKLVMSLAGIAVLILVAAACGNGGGSGSNEALKGLTGSINVDGSSTVYPISQAVAEEFGKDASKVKVTIGESGTGGGFEKFCRGEIDISDASRPIKDEEKAKCTAAEIEFTELKIAIDGLSVLVNPQNTWVDCLTKDELKKIWEPKSRVKNWSQVRAGFPNKPLTLYGPGTASGTFDYFTKEMVGEEGASRSDYTASEDDNVLVTGVAGDANALGYFGFAYYEQNTEKLKVIGVDSGTGCIKPSKETIEGGTYKPLSRPLFIYVAKKSVAKEQVKSFVDFYLENVNDLVPDVGYIALPSSEFSATEQTWSAAAA
ncbi:MAG: PstS family phosphate ABC transporter substrate-binding protein [Actinomycetota bacterium]